MFRLKVMSAAPSTCTPGAPGFSRGWRFVSSIGLIDAITGVEGSAMGALIYLRIAELMPPAKPVLPRVGLARIQ